MNQLQQPIPGASLNQSAAEPRPRRTLKGFLAALTVGALAVSALAAVTPPPAASAATRITCIPNGLVVTLPSGQSVSRLSRIDITNGAYTLSPIGDLLDAVNSIGYSTDDGLLYGTNGPGQFVQFGQDAGAGQVNLGYSSVNGQQITSAAWSNQFYNGAVGRGNIHYMIATQASDNVRYLLRTNLNARPLTTTLTRISGPLAGVPADMAFNPYDGLLYTESAGGVYTINPASGVTAAVTGVTGPVATQAGAAWTDSLGNLFFWDSVQGGVISKYNPQTKTAVRVSNAGPQSGFDGTACLPPSMAKSVSPANAKVGETVTFTFNIGNPGADQITTTDFVDTLPSGAGLEWVANGVTPASPGGGQVSISGGTLRINEIMVPAASSGLQSFSARAIVTNAATAGNYINTATLDYNGTRITSDDPSLPGSADGTAFRVRVPPAAATDTATTAQDVTSRVSVLGNDIGNGATLTANSVRLVTPGTGALVTTLTVPDQGTYTANTDGTVSFDPLPTFTGTATPVTYSVADGNNDRSTSTLTMTVTPATAPTASPDTATTAYNTPVTVTPTANDTPGAANTSFDPASVRLTDPATGNPVTSLTIADEGTYAVNGTTGEVTFTPLATFTGEATPVTYTASTTFGGTVTSTITPTVGTPDAPTATDDTATAPARQAASFSPLNNDSSGPTGTAFDPTSLRLTDPVTGDPVTTVTVPGEGRWDVSTTGTVTFTPEDDFSGEATPIEYQVTTNVGDIARANLTPTIGEPPVATDDTGTAGFNTPATVDVLANDEPGTDASLDPTSVRLLDADGQAVTSLTIPQKGTFTIDSTTGAVTFTPVSGFSGEVSTPYRVADSNGTTTTATVTVQITAQPVAKADIANTPAETAVGIDVLGNDTADADAPLDVTTVTFPTDGQPDGAVVSADGRTLTLPGQGVFTSDPTTGQVTFTPETGFAGSVDTVRYSVDDANGISTSSTIIVVVGDPPIARDDTTATPFGTGTGPIDVLANDFLSADDPVDLDTVVFPLTGQPAGATITDGGKTLEIADVGTYTIGDDGSISFTPATDFSGTAPDVQYAFATEAGNTATGSLTVDVGDPVVATDDTATTPAGATVVVDVLGNDTSDANAPLRPATMVFSTSGQPGGSTLSDDGRTLTVPDEGVYTIDPTSGQISFVPEATFTGDTTPVVYTVSDSNGATDAGSVTIAVGPLPVATDDTASTLKGDAVQIPVIDNDEGPTGVALDRASVRFPATGQPGGSITSNGGRTLTVPGEGTYTVDATTGVVTFDPDDDFTGTASAVTYQVADVNGAVDDATVTVTVDAPPVATNDTTTTAQDTPVAIDVTANDDAGTADVDVTSVRLIDPDTGAQLTTLTVADEGTYVVDTTTGEVTFTPLATFSGTATPVTYSIADVDGLRDQATLTVTVTPATAPTAAPDTPTAAYNTPVTFNPTANDASGSDRATFVPGSVRLIDPVTGDEVTTVTIAGEGTYTVDEVTGEVTFTPVATFRGEGTAVSYTASTTFGENVRSTITPTIGDPGTATATDDSGSGIYGAAVTVSPLANDSTGDANVIFDRTTLRLVDPVTGDAVTAVAVPNEGTWQLDATTGQVTFSPVDGFEGPTTPLGYQVQTSAGDTVRADITVTSGSAPTARPDSATGPSGRTATLDVVANDTAGSNATFDRGSVRLRDADGTLVTTLELPGQGVWSVNATTGAVTFAPVDGFSGTVTVPYSVADSDGNRAASTVSVTIAGPPTAAPDVATGPQGAPVTLRPLANDTQSATGAVLDPSTLRLIDPETGATATQVTVVGQGVWTVDAAGQVIFTPEAGFTGTATPLGYSASDTDGVAVRSTVTVSIRPTPPVAKNDSGIGRQGEPITIDPLGNDKSGRGDLVASSVRLIGPDGQLVTTLLVTGQGTFTVDTTSGAITFTPETGFTGIATVRYSVANTSGTRAEANVEFTITGTPGITPNPPSQGGGVSVTLPNGDQLAFTGSQGVLAASGAALGLVLLGLVLTVIRRRRGESA